MRGTTGLVLPSGHVEPAASGGPSRSAGSPESLLGQAVGMGCELWPAYQPISQRASRSFEACCWGPAAQRDSWVSWRCWRLAPWETASRAVSRCSLTVRRGRWPAPTPSPQVDELQYARDQGPCLSALRGGNLIRVDDPAGERRRERFAPAALARGVRSSLSLPLIAAGRPIGAFSLYSRAADFFGADATRRAERFGQNASGAVGLGGRLAVDGAMAAQLRASLASRAVIDQATGVLMAQRRCTPQRAFALLRTASQNRNVRLREVAAHLVLGVSGWPPQRPPFSPPG